MLVVFRDLQSLNLDSIPKNTFSQDENTSDDQIELEGDKLSCTQTTSHYFFNEHSDNYNLVVAAQEAVQLHRTFEQIKTIKSGAQDDAQRCDQQESLGDCELPPSLPLLRRESSIDRLNDRLNSASKVFIICLCSSQNFKMFLWIESESPILQWLRITGET